MASFAIDPSDDLYAEGTSLPSNNVRATAKSGVSLGTIAIGLAVAGGMAGLAELWTGAISDMMTASRPKSEIVMGPVAEMPEIKNGVVAVGSAPPVRVIPGPAPTLAAAPQSPAAPRPSEMKAVSAPPVASPAVAAAPTPAMVPSPKPVAALRVATGSTNPAAPVAASAAIPRPLAAVPAPPAAAPRSLAAAPAPSTAPLPPTRAASRATGNVLASVVTQPPVTAPPVMSRPAVSPSAAMSPPAPMPPVRSAQRKPDAPAPAQRVASARTPAADTAEAQERSLLGIPVPGFVPSGNDIKSGFDSIGDAVMSLPKRF
jgi:hypothetical protein